MRGNPYWLNHAVELTPLKKDRPYLTIPELRRFRALRESGSMTMFRCASCAHCKAEIPESFLFCSKECWERENDVA
jgi:hypothetical protein